MGALKSALAISAGAVMLSAAALQGAAAQQGADFFKGKTVAYIVPTAAGGGYDIYGRLVADFMQKYLPGSTFVVKNMPGAAHVLGTNTLYASRADGLTIGTFNMGLLHAQIAGSSGVKFDLKRMSWIGKAAEDPRVFVVAPHTGIKTFEELLARKDVFKFAVSGAGGANFIEQSALISIFKIPARLLTGYNGNDDKMAIRRGEIDGTLASRSAYNDFVRNGYARIVAQIGGSDPVIPQLMSFAPDDTAKALVGLIEAQSQIARLTAGPPDIPADRLSALRAAFAAAMNDGELKARADKLELPLAPQVGEQVGAAVQKALDQAPAAHEVLKKIAQDLKETRNR